MRYTINPIKHDKLLSNYTNYTYNIYDNKNKENILKEEYDIIIDIIEDKYAIVGIAEIDVKLDGLYLYYRYGLVNMKGEKITKIMFKAIYPYNNIIYCRPFFNSVNKMSFNNKYIWQKGDECFESEVPLKYITEKGAIIDKSDNENVKITLLNNKGIIVDEIEYNAKSENFSIYKINAIKNYLKSSDGFVWCSLLQKPIPKKWNKINYCIELSNKDDKIYDYNNLCNITLNDGTIIKDVIFYIRNNNFLILKKEDCHEFCMVLNSNFEIIFNEMCGQYGLKSNRIGDKLLLLSKKGDVLINENGDKFYIPKNLFLNHNGKNYCVNEYYRFLFDNIDSNDYMIYKDNYNFGYINIYGEIVIPAIFPEEDWVQSNGYIPDDIIKESYEAFEDAFEGDSDALWNID